MTYVSVTLNEAGQEIAPATTSPLSKTGPQSEADLIRVNPSSGVHRATQSDIAEYDRCHDAGAAHVTERPRTIRTHPRQRPNNDRTPRGPQRSTRPPHRQRLGSRCALRTPSTVASSRRQQRALHRSWRHRDRSPGERRRGTGPCGTACADRSRARRRPGPRHAVVASIVDADPEYAGDLYNDSIEAAVEGSGTSFDADRVATALGITPRRLRLASLAWSTATSATWIQRFRPLRSRRTGVLQLPPRRAPGRPA